MKRRFIFENRGVLDLPMRLLIIMVILGITIPIIIGGFMYFTRIQKENQLDARINELKMQIIQVYRGGENTDIRVDIEFPSETEYIHIGGSLNGDYTKYRIEYKIYSTIRSYAVLDGAKNIPMCSDSGDTLKIGGAKYALSLKKLTYPGDIDGDGFSPDFYVQIKVLQ
ncbi:MAG: hypothetical protein ACPL1Y_03055, partial [Thermoplasmata archaeon]